MMRGMIRTMMAAGCLVVAGAVTAEAQTPVQFGVGGGVSIPTGSTSDGLKLGFNGQALVRFTPPASPVGFQIDGMYQQFKAKTNTFGLDKDQIISGTADVVYDFPVSEETRIRPYLIGGGGVYNLKSKFTDGSSGSDTKFGLNAGAGFDFGVSGATIYAEGRFHNVFVTGSDVKFIPITVGVKFGGR
ncbi:MAG TPA: porin family protein [Gemmatimonadales bacterium]|nr:porin family protein [Gemmatimonadales bacterium]